MGQWYLFKCPSCNYETECSAGPDRGMFAAVEPMICFDCKEVHNVVTGEFDRQGNYKDYEKFKCHSCKGSSLKGWKNNECPKCNSKMNHSHKKAILWD